MTKRLRLDSVLLFALVIPFIMTYRLGPSDTPYWWFGIIFLLLLSSLVLDLLAISVKKYFLYKKIVIWGIIAVVIGSAFIAAIIVRHTTHPIYMIHDIVLQQEAAIRFLLDGKNPYAVTYFGTPLEEWHYSEKETNPALYHFVMQPFYVLFALPFYFVSNHTIGYFDGRIPLLFLFIVMLFVGSRMIKDEDNKRLFLVVMAFNPAMLGYSLEGRSDMFMFAFLLFGFYFLQKKMFSVAGMPIALSFAIKQSAWPILPLYIAYLYFQKKSVRSVVKTMIPFMITFLAVVFPFFFWDTKAFLDSTVFYLSGSVANSYPVSGYGLGMLLYQWGLIKDLHAYYPFIIWQIIVCLPLFVGFLFYLGQSPNIQRLMFTYAVFLFVFWYLSRYFNNSHVAYLSVLFITTYFLPDKELK